MPSPDHHPASPPALDVERVDWTPAEHGTLIVHVGGRWRGGSPPGGPIALLVQEAGGRRRFEALPADGGPPAGGAWSAAFSLPAQLRSALAEGLALEAGGSEHALPGARPRPADALEAGTGEEGEVVDRAVLAERRARRAELLEEALTRRATEAEQAVGALEDHLHGLEQRLGELTAERDELSGRLAEREQVLEAARAEGSEAQALRRELADVRAGMDAEAQTLREALAQARAGATAEEERLQADLEVARAGAAQAEALRADLEEARATLAGEQARAVAAEARAAAAEDRAAVLEARAAALEEHAAGLERDLAEAVEQLKAGREEVGSFEAAAADRYAAAQAIAAARHRAAELDSRLAAVEAERLAPPPASPPVWAPVPERGEGADALTDARSRLQSIHTDLGGLGARLGQGESAPESTVTQSDLREGLDRLHGELREDLAAEHERQRHELTELREVADHVRELRDELASTMAQVRAQLAPGRAVDEPHGPSAAPVHVSAPLSALAQAVDRARAEAPAPLDERLVADLGEAAERLRAETPPAEEHESPQPPAAVEELEPEAPAAVEAHDPEAPAAVEVRESPPELPAAVEVRESPPELPAAVEVRESPPELPAAVEAREPEAPAPEREPAGAEEAAFPARVVAPEDRVENDWLARAILDMAADDPRRAGQLVVELLPSQRLTARRALTYDLTVQEAGAVRVHLDRGQARVERRTRPATATEEVALRLAGPAAALAPLAAGGARWRLPGARVEGSRWALHRLLRTRRDPVSLAELARTGERLDPGLVLTALARAVDPDWARDSELSVAYHLTVGGGTEDDADATWVVTAFGEGPLRVRSEPMPRAWASAPESAMADIALAPAPGPSPTPEAGLEPTTGTPDLRSTVHVPAPALMALLAREELPGEATATIEGDVDAVALLHAWFDRVQGLPVAD